MNPYFGLAVDAAMLGALAFTIYHGVRLSRQFDRLQADRKAFEQFVQSLNLASARAEAAIRSLREAAVESGDALQARIAQARALADEMDIMIQAGDSLANRLGTLAESARKAPGASEQPEPRTRAEKDLADALKSRQKSL